SRPAVLPGAVFAEGDKEPVDDVGLELRQLVVAQGGEDFVVQLLLVFGNSPRLEIELGVLVDPSGSVLLQGDFSPAEENAITDFRLKLQGELLHGLLPLLGGKGWIWGECGRFQQLLPLGVVSAGDGDLVAAVAFSDAGHGDAS